MGTKKRPYYRIVVADVRSPRDGRFIEQLGIYQPLEKENQRLKFNAEKIKEWFFNGAKPTHVIRKLLNKQGFRFDRKLLSVGK